jgi:HPt (histidine-containing phosphotransfer) domain-containing protein
MAESDIIDPAALQTILAMTGNDSSFLAELIDAYVDDTRQLLVAMRQALDSGHAGELRRAAHDLKSNSAHVGALRLSALCQGLEEVARSGVLDGADARRAQVEATCEQVECALLAARPAGDGR